MEAVGELGINLYGLIGQIVNFVILLILLMVIGYRPIRRMLDERSAMIKAGMEQAELIKEQAARAEQEVQAQLETARREGQSLIAQATQLGGHLKEEARQEARREAEAIVARARVEIQAEREEAMAELRKQVVDIAILAAEKVISESLDKAKHQRLIDEVLEEMAPLREGSGG